MLRSHYRAGSGAVLVETREEWRQLHELLAEFNDVPEIATIAAPGGLLKDARTGESVQGISGLNNAYAWLQKAPGRVVVAYDFHMLVNNPGAWRSLRDALQDIRVPLGCRDADGNTTEGAHPSLVVFVAPTWSLINENPLRGELPLLPFAPPDRDAIRTLANNLHPLNGNTDAVIDALCGLGADAATQCAAEVLERTGMVWDVDALRQARRQSLKEAGLEIWPTVNDIGGLGGIKGFVNDELLPWVRDEQLSVRRLLCAGVPGVGKSFIARWLAGQLKCECARLSIPALKGGLVGQSEGNLRRALAAIDALGKHSPVVVVMDEIDTVAREGLDGGTSSGMFAELLTWLQESTSQAVCICTLNRLDKLDAALESRMQARFFFDLPSERERRAVCEIHYKRLGCANFAQAAQETAALSEGFSSRELAEHIIPSVARLSKRTPTREIIKRVVDVFTPASKTQEEQLEAMRKAAKTLRLANDPREEGAKPAKPGSRLVKAG